MSVQSETRGAGIIDAGYATALPVNFVRLDQNVSTGSYPAYTTFSSALPATRAGGTGNTVVSFDSGSEQYYLVRETNNKSKLLGWYPRVNGTTVTMASGVLTFTLDGSTDVMLSNEVEAYKTTGNQFSDTGKEFTFSHQLTQFRVNAYAADAASITSWGTVTDIKILSQLPTCAITLPSTVAFSGTAADLSLEKKLVATNAAITYPVTLGLTSAECGYTMVPPVASTTTVNLQVTTSNGGTRNVPLTLQAYDKGKAYVVTLKFSVTSITAKAQIAAWTAVPMTDITL
jgi:hypothetical protein